MERLERGYKKIDYTRFFGEVDKQDSNFVQMTKFEINAVNKIILPSRTGRDVYYYEENRKSSYLIAGDVAIYKNFDDWFFVNIMSASGGRNAISPVKENNFYECDQLEGLINLLKDKYRSEEVNEKIKWSGKTTHTKSDFNCYMRIKNYQDFLILEKFDDNIIAELKRLGVTAKEEINQYLYHAHRGNLAEYLKQHGKKFTFGMLNALFKDARDAKRKTDLKVGIIKAAHRILPMALAPFFPMVAIVGYILGSSRAFNKVIAPILADPGNDYPAFLKKVIDATMRVAEGDLTITKDRFTRSFVVSDRIVDAIKPEVLQKFSLFLSEKMSLENPQTEVPDHYIENELKKYLNDHFGIDPEIPTKES